MSVRPGAVSVLGLGLILAFSSAPLLIPTAWAGQTFHHFSEDGTPLRAAPSAPKAPAVQQPKLNLPAQPSSQAKVPAVMMDNITKKSAHQQADGDPDRPLTLGNVYNQESQGQGEPAAMQGFSMGKLKVQGDMDPQGRQALGDFLGTTNPLPLPQGGLAGPGAEPSSQGPLKLKGTLSDGSYKPGEGVSFEGKIKDKGEPGAAKGEVVVIGSKVKEAIKAAGVGPPADVQDMKGDITRMK